MKVSLNWLKEFVDFKLTAKDLADKIAMSTVEVEEIIDFEKLYKGVLVGEIKEIKKHPNADKLHIAKIDIGQKKIQVIFGSLFKVNVGEKMPVAVAPAVLPSGLRIEKTVIRGVESYGMICSDKELDIFCSDLGLIKFPPKTKLGEPIVKVLGIHDVVFNLDVLSNRADLFSHVGVAREIGAILGKKNKLLKIKLEESRTKKTKDFLEVEVKDQNFCPRYEARVIMGIKVQESPGWLKNRLIVLGIRPVNNIVDITNYVMFETGQPLHAFDYDKLAGPKNKKKIVVRTARSKEEIVTLDEKLRKLSKEILVIADHEKPIAVAGVMGGKDSEVSEGTKSIVLESANFDWVSIRKSARILGLRSEAVIRFEKGLDPHLTEQGLDRAAMLIKEICGGDVVSGKIDRNYTKETTKLVELRLKKLDQFLGQKNSPQKVKNILTSLGMEVSLGEGKIIVKIPSFRRDIKEEADLIEEVARIYGYDKIPITFPIEEVSPVEKNEIVKTELEIKSLLRGMGANEVLSYSFVGDELLRKFNDSEKNLFKLKNPLKPEHSYLRKNLVFSLVEIAEANAKNYDEFTIFEVAKVFGEMKTKFPKEQRKISILTYSKRDSFYKLKGIIENMFDYMGIKDFSFERGRNHSEFWHPERVASVMLNGKNIGRIGELHPEIWEKFDFKNRFSTLEIDFDEIVNKKRTKIFSPFSRFPKIILDLAIILDDKLEEAIIRKEIMSASPELINKIELFDTYRGSQVGTGKKSLAYHVTYQSTKKTLTDAEVNVVHQNIIKALTRNFNAKIRA